jgi:hypothetical protein
MWIDLFMLRTLLNNSEICHDPGGAKISVVVLC